MNAPGPQRRRRRSASVEWLEGRLLMARATGADISQYQGTMNWTTYKNQGTSFAILRASSSDFGTGSDANGNAVDTRFIANAANAKTAGVLYGVYHYGYPQSATQTAVQQADYFYSTASARMTVGYLPPVLDLETGGTELGVAGLSTWANAFCQELYSKTGVKPLIYCNTNYAQNFVNTSVAQWPLWIA